MVALRTALFYGMSVCVLLLASLNVHAGSIAFRLSLTSSVLALTQLGDSSAFYPSVLRMLPDGRWETLLPAPGTTIPNELVPGATVNWFWQEIPSLQPPSEITRLQPMMVRFFDQAGVSFGQISFFNQPPPSTDVLNAEHKEADLVLTPPARQSSIQSSWVLWPQEEGIRQINEPVQFEHRQPSAQRIVWGDANAKVRVHAGAGQPAAVLLHETAQGYRIQTLSSGGLQGRQQRAAWLDATRWFYGMGIVLGGAAIVMVLFNFIRGRQKMAVVHTQQRGAISPRQKKPVRRSRNK